ncbi:MAG: undecaprenyl-phosphate glucose phosphotransferase [candidate division Zixibacteria bacterium]|nr:undecaprenyl-phosphate glucose phosphotransferase [candidate division Zixibacteria bacterium]
MKKETFRHIFPFFLFLADVIIIFSSILLAYWVRFYSLLTEIVPVTKGIPPLSFYLYGSIFVVVVWVAVFNAYGLYKSTRPKSAFDEFYLLAKSATLGFLVVLAFTFFYRDTSYSRATLVASWILGIVLLYGERRLMARVERHFTKRGYGVKKAIIVGTGEMGLSLYKRWKENPQLGFKLIGLVEGGGKYEEQTNPMVAPDIQVLGTIDDLSRIIKDENVELVILALPLSYHHKIMEIILGCEDLKVEFQIVPDMFEIMAARAKVVSLDGVPLISLGRTPLEGWNRILKRSVDVTLSAAGLVLLSPVFAILAILIKLDSKGSVFYKQERLGRDGKRFIHYKFRSMIENAEEKTGPTFAQDDDPRRTKVGAFMRRNNFDEFPQLFNVLKGDMSLVGPRPERKFFVDKFKEGIPRYFLRHKVKSGITGWAQVNGLRGNTSIEERTKYDLFYMENWSLAFDIKILLLTLKDWFSSKNAY